MKTLSVLYAIAALAFASSALAAPDDAKTTPPSANNSASATAPPDCAASRGPRQTESVSRSDGGKTAMDDWTARCAASPSGGQPQTNPPASVGVPALDGASKDAAK